MEELERDLREMEMRRRDLQKRDLDDAVGGQTSRLHLPLRLLGGNIVSPVLNLFILPLSLKVFLTEGMLRILFSTSIQFRIYPSFCDPAQPPLLSTNYYVI